MYNKNYKNYTNYKLQELQIGIYGLDRVNCYFRSKQYEYQNEANTPNEIKVV